MKRYKSPQEWYLDNGHIFMHFVRRNGERIKIKASVEDLPRLCKYRWGVDGKGRAYTEQITGKYLSMHRFIMNPPDDMVIDHINNDHQDNRRSNMRICTHAQNLKNQVCGNGSAVGYKGVSRDKDKRKKRYRAKIGHDGVLINIGSFKTPEEAARAYDKEAMKLHGEFAKTNKELGLL